MHVWMGYRFCDCFDVLTRAIVIFMYQLKVHQKIAVSLLSAKWKFNGVPLIIIEDLSFLKWVFITSLVKFWYNRICMIRSTYILRDWVEVHETELRYMLAGMAELIGWKSKIKFSTFNGRQRSFTPVSEVFDPYATIHATHFRPFTPVVPVTAAFDYVSKFIKKVRVWKER